MYTGFMANPESSRWVMWVCSCAMSLAATWGCGSDSSSPEGPSGAHAGDAGTGGAEAGGASLDAPGTGGAKAGGTGSKGGAGPSGGDGRAGSTGPAGGSALDGAEPGGSSPTGDKEAGGAAPAGGGASGGAPGGAGPTSVCGDRDCDAGETCDSCAVDCGECEQPVVTECNDGIDNDGDGLVDWQFDVGCYAASDATEASGSRAAEAGWTTFDLSPDSAVVYVSSSDGDDGNDGLTPETPVATPARGAELVRDGYPDFLLLKRGDTWRAQDMGDDRVVRRFKSGQDADHPLVIASYGDSTERPRLEIDKNFIDHDGNERSFLAIVGLAFISYPKVPTDAAFNGIDGGGLRLIGTGRNVLVEDNYFQYGELVVQNEHDVEIRRNVVYRSYEAGTCAYNADGSRDPNGNNATRPSGMFAGSVDGLLIEGNVWDENGWNPDVAEACATIYDHDLYLSDVSRLKVIDNLVLRASSIGIKMSSDGPGQANDILIENNLFAEGEIGISMGGNADTEHRFADAEISNNVFTDIGRSQPTTRTLTWYIDLIDNDGTLVQNNLLVNQPPLGNGYGISLSGGSNRDVTIRENFIYGLARRQLLVDAQAPWSNIHVDANTFVADADEACLVSHEGGFDAFTFSDNAYASPADPSAWFCVDGERQGLAGWVASSGETGATAADVSPPDVGRNLDSYAELLGIGTTLDDFAAAARRQSRHTYRPELSAPNAANYIREGYGVALR
jgi:hypothetical protein